MIDLSIFPIALLISFVWGLQPIIHKMLLNSHIKDPKVIFFLSGFFYMIALSVFAVVNLSTLKSSIRKLETKVLVIIAFTAIVTGFLPNLLYYFILQKSTSYLIATLIYSSPIFTLIASFFLLKEKITLYGFAGILSIIIGVVLLALNEIYIH